MMTKIEDIVENLNGFGRYQKWRFFLLCLSGFLPAIGSYMHSFIAPNPRYSCNTTQNISFTMTNSLDYYYSDEYKFKCVDRTAQLMGESFNNETLFGNLSRTTKQQRKKCSAFVYDKTYYKSTLTEQWNLVCDRAIWRPLMQTIYFAGVLFGSIILGIVGRRYGQKLTLVLSLLITLVGSVALSFGPQEWFGFQLSYLFLVVGRFLIAFGSHGISINGYLLVMEFIGRRQKRYCALVFEFSFSFGQLLLVLAAYFLRDWRHLTFIILLPCLPFFLFIYFTNESIQYLLRHKKYDKIERVLTNIAASNKTDFDQPSWKSLLSKESEKVRKPSSSTSQVSKPNLIYLIVIVLNWIVNNFVFHGLGLRSNDLGIDPYLSFFGAALAELLCSVFTYELLKFNYRRVPYFFFMLITGVCCTTVYFSKNLYLTVPTALIARFTVSSTYAIMRLYTSEILPEDCRKAYMTRCSILARFGGVIAPLVIAIGDYYLKQLPFLVFGVSCFVSSLSTLILPRVEKDVVSSDVKKTDKNQQLLQNNWLDVQDIYEIENLESVDETEMRSFTNNNNSTSSININNTSDAIFNNANTTVCNNNNENRKAACNNSH